MRKHLRHENNRKNHEHQKNSQAVGLSQTNHPAPSYLKNLGERLVFGNANKRRLQAINEISKCNCFLCK
jgi:hypothetical protein